MLRLCFRLPRLGVLPQIKRICPRCHGHGEIHGDRIRHLQDVQRTETLQVRMKCGRCAKTWSYYPTVSICW